MIVAICFGMLLTAVGAEADTRIDALFGDYGRKTPGVAVLVARDGKILHKKCYGMADLEKRLPMTPKTACHTASISKVFTATAILLLVENGKISLDDPLTAFFPQCPPFARDITIRNLLSHTGGVNMPFLRLEGTLTNWRVLEMVTQLEQPDFPPGSRWSYSNTAFILSAMIVERVTGMNYREFLRSRILEPLKMSRTYVMPETAPAAKRRAKGYRRDGNGFSLEERMPRDQTFGHNGLWTTLEDLYRFDQSLYGERLLKSATIQEMFTPMKLADGSAGAYGLGWNIRTHRGLTVVCQEGTAPGTRAILFRIPSERFTVILLSNLSELDPIPTAERIADVFLSP